MKYRKKPVAIEAVQWLQSGDHPEVEDRIPLIIFDRAKNYFYISHSDNDLPIPKCWTAIDFHSEVAKKNGPVLPFAFYEVKSGDTAPASKYPTLYDRYCVYMKWVRKPRSLGYIKTLEGGHIVTPGDYIIRGVKDELYPCKPDIFEMTYEPVDDGVKYREGE